MGVDSHILRFKAKMISIEQCNQDRIFVISYYLTDDQISIYERAARNSGDFNLSKFSTIPSFSKVLPTLTFRQDTHPAHFIQRGKYSNPTKRDSYPSNLRPFKKVTFGLETSLNLKVSVLRSSMRMNTVFVIWNCTIKRYINVNFREF